VLAASLPSLLYVRFVPIEVLRGSLIKQTKGNTPFKTALRCFQFAISIALYCGKHYIVYNQILPTCRTRTLVLMLKQKSCFWCTTYADTTTQAKVRKSFSGNMIQTKDQSVVALSDEIPE